MYNVTINYLYYEAAKARLKTLEDALAVGEVRGLALAEAELLEVAAAGGLVVQGVEEVDADRVRDGGRPGPLPRPGGAAPRQPQVQVVPLQVEMLMIFRNFFHNIWTALPCSRPARRHRRRRPACRRRPRCGRYRSPRARGCRGRC